MPAGMTIMTRAAGPTARRPRDERRRRADAARPGPRPDPRRLAGRRRLLALDLLRQPADRRGGAGARGQDPADATSPQPQPEARRVGLALLSPGLALFVYGLAETASLGRLRLASRCGCRSSPARVADRGLRRATRCATTQPLIDMRLFRNKTVRASALTTLFFGCRVLRRDAAAAALLPDGARRVARSTPACCSPRRASARWSRCRSPAGSPTSTGAGPDRARRPASLVTLGTLPFAQSARTRRTGCSARRCSSAAWAWARR